MAKEPIIVSAFLDEGVPVEEIKDLQQQLIIGQALGLKYWTPRFIYDEASSKNVNMVTLSNEQIDAVIKASKDAGFKIGCLGTAIGKERLIDKDDGNPAPYTTPEQSKEKMKKVIEVAVKAEASFIRAFSFYGIKEQKPEDFYKQALDRVSANVELCEGARKIYLIELETNLVAYCADMALRFCKDIDSPYLLICTDAANSHVQGRNAVEEYKKVAQRGKLGYIHIKDYTKECHKAIVVDEEALKHFGSVDVGVAGHKEILKDLETRIAYINARLRGLGAPGLIADIEGHMKGGGQFGGFSGPDGLGVAVRAFTKMLDEVGIPYVTRQYGDIKKK